VTKYIIYDKSRSITKWRVVVRVKRKQLYFGSYKTKHMAMGVARVVTRKILLLRKEYDNKFLNHLVSLKQEMEALR